MLLLLANLEVCSSRMSLKRSSAVPTRRLLFLLTVLALGFATERAQIQSPPIYLALGDSSAFGEINRTKNPSNGDRGYVLKIPHEFYRITASAPSSMCCSAIQPRQRTSQPGWWSLLRFWWPPRRARARKKS